MTVHILKTVSPYFEAIESGAKTFEIRSNDRVPAFAVGGVLQLRHHLSVAGETEIRTVTYVTDFPEGLRPGFVVLGIREPTREELDEALRAYDAGRVSQ